MSQALSPTPAGTDPRTCDPRDFYADAKWERKPDGFVLIDNVEVAVTMQCVHCQTHFVSRRGSGTRRGWCPQCQRVTCGSKRCDVCKPFEQKLDEIERRASREFRLGI